ncbi:MAG TPA: formyltransferase family protein [Gaiellaceae bacterium]|nr:formyltransferase family protein [Gaiellaceae bacterium]
MDALCESGRAPTLAIGYPPTLAHRSGYASLADLCERYRVPLLETDDVNAPEILARVRDVEPEVLLVTGWSQLLRPELLSIPRHGAVGFHPTSLPEGRGRAPIPWTLIKGVRRSAVSLFWLTEGVDDGPLIAQAPFEVDLHDDAATLYAKVRELHVRLLLDYVDAIVAGTAPAEPQEGEPSYWPQRRPEDGAIDWARPAAELYDWIRALTHPFPGAFTATADGRRLRVWSADLLELGGMQAGPPGTVLGALRSAGRPEGGVVVAAGSDALALRRVSLDDEPETDALALLDVGALQYRSVLG